MTQVPVVINRRSNDRFHIDWSFNITSILAVAALLFTLIKYGNAVLVHLQRIDSRTNVMWMHFDKTQLTKEELEQILLYEK